MKSKLPRIKQQADSVGLPLEVATVLVTNDEIVGKIDSLIMHAQENGIATYKYDTDFASGLQKLSVNKILGSLDQYKSRFAVPVRLLVNENGEILMDDKVDVFSFEGIQQKIDSILVR